MVASCQDTGVRRGRLRPLCEQDQPGVAFSDGKPYRGLRLASRAASARRTSAHVRTKASTVASGAAEATPSYSRHVTCRQNTKACPSCLKCSGARAFSIKGLYIISNPSPSVGPSGSAQPLAAGGTKAGRAALCGKKGPGHSKSWPGPRCAPRGSGQSTSASCKTDGCLSRKMPRAIRVPRECRCVCAQLACSILRIDLPPGRDYDNGYVLQRGLRCCSSHAARNVTITICVN